MKYSLPRSFKSFCGFTLIELLVVIAIIAILAVVAVSVFAVIPRNSRDARRKADLDAIVKALEVNKTTSGYVGLSNSQFANNSIPTTDPQGYPYCANSTASTQPADPSPWTTTCQANYAQVGTANPPAGTSWKICTTLENGGTPQVLCRGNAQ